MVDDRLLRQLSGLEKPPGYQGHMERMAGRLRVDIQAALDRKDISLSGVHHLMSRCSACGDKAGCQTWMQTHPGLATHPYQRCLDGKMLMALRDQARKRSH